MPVDAVRRDIEVLHAFFEDWFAGRPGDFEGVFLARLAPGFRMVRPDGRMAGRSELVERLRNAFGAHPDIKIAIQDVAVLERLGDALLVSYEEWQDVGRGAPRGRISTAVLRPGTPFEWLFVHETWLPDEE